MRLDPEADGCTTGGEREKKKKRAKDEGNMLEVRNMCENPTYEMREKRN